MSLDKLVTTAIDIAAVYRLTKLVLDDKITEDIREKVFEKYPPSESKIGYLLTCPWCVSIWAGLVIYGVRKANPHAGDILAYTLAASAVTGKAYEAGL